MVFVLLVHAVQNIGYCTQMLLESKLLSIGFNCIILMQHFYLLCLTLFFCCVILRSYSCKKRYINIIFFSLCGCISTAGVKSLIYCILMTACCLFCTTTALDTCYLSGFLYFAVWYTALSRVLFIDLCIPMALTVTLVTECNFKQFFRIQH